MNRRSLQQLAAERLEDAKALQRAGRDTAAVYLAGYAVECMLKAAICARLAKEEAFPDRNSKQFYVHDLDELLALAGLREIISADERVAKNWMVIQTWNPEQRYAESSIASIDDFMNALEDPESGILPWLFQRYPSNRS